MSGERGLDVVKERARCCGIDSAMLEGKGKDGVTCKAVTGEGRNRAEGRVQGGFEWVVANTRLVFLMPGGG
jgi:hypothetical protein